MRRKLFGKIVALASAVTMLTQIFPTGVNAEESLLTGKTASEITAMMGKGWNLGNTFDATGGNKEDIYSHETAWGNPKVTKELIDGVKASGLNTIRIPITWADYVDTNKGYEIYPEYMARVKEVVDYAYDAGLFVIINVHHEEWVNRPDIDTAYEEIGKELVAVWKQISDTFCDYDQHLIFEGMNEPRAKETSYEWTGNKACYEAVNYLDQLFVETVRGNGKGYNSERMLMIPGYAASSNPSVLKSIKLPEINGETASNLCVSVHCYSPYEFCLTDKQTTFDPKKSGDTADIKALFNNLNSLFINQGIPVVIGECGATNSGDNYSARQAWFAYMGEISSKNNIPAVIWDNGINGTSSGECHYYFVRETGEEYAKELVEAFITGSIGLEAENLSLDFEPVNDGEHTTVLDPSELGFSSKLYTQMKINHTEGAPTGFALRVDAEAPDFEAVYNIGRYNGHTLRIAAWIYSEEGANVSVGVKGENSAEMANVSATSEWTEVRFDVDVPESGKCELYFKGDAEFFIDDFSIEMDPKEPLTMSEKSEDNANVSDTENAGDNANNAASESTLENTGDASNETDNAKDAAKTDLTNNSESGHSSRTVIIIIVLALVALTLAGVFVSKNKKK